MSIRRVMIFEDKEEMQFALRKIFEGWKSRYKIVGIYPNSSAICAKVKMDKPDIILMDIHMPGGNGIEGLHIIRKCDSDVKILMLTYDDNENKVIEVIREHANGYLLKSQSDGFNFKLLDAIDQIFESGAYIEPKVQSILIKKISKSKPISLEILSEKEQRVATSIKAGNHKIKEIAKDLGKSADTIKTQLSSIRRKLGMSSKTDLILFLQSENLEDLLE